jgi:hypothetical protein
LSSMTGPANHTIQTRTSLQNELGGIPNAMSMPQ